MSVFDDNVCSEKASLSFCLFHLEFMGPFYWVLLSLLIDSGGAGVGNIELPKNRHR